MSDFRALNAQRRAKRASPSGAGSAVAGPSQLERQLPPSLRVRSIEGRGRAIVANSAFRPGETILSTRPLIVALDRANVGVRCSSCYKSAEDSQPAKPLLQCSTCKVVRYCSSTCQSADWVDHKFECKAILNFGNSRPPRRGKALVPDSALRALGRMVWRAKGDELVWDKLRSMESHLPGLTSDEKEKLFQLSVSLAAYVGQELVAEVTQSATELLGLCSRFQCNSFSLTTPDLSNIGVCTSPVTALFNHSCRPNAVVVFPEFSTPSKSDTMKVVAIAPIAPGEEIVTSYVDLTLPAALRRKDLAERYRFSCDCEECARAELRGKADVDPREAVACAALGCAGVGWLPELKLVTAEVAVECSMCGAQVTIHAERLEAAVDSAVELLKRVEVGDTTDATTQVERSIEQLRSFSLAPTCYPLLNLEQSLLSSRIASGYFDRQTSSLALRVLASLRAVLPVHHPSRGIAAAVTVRLRGTDESDFRVWNTRDGMMETGQLARAALAELRGMGPSARVANEVKDVLSAVEEGMGRLQLSREVSFGSE